MATRPPSAVASERTTSIPTPRPASSVTTCAVVKPGLKIRSVSSASETLWSCVSKPVASALLRIRCRSSPPPSSENCSTTSLPSWRISTRNSPVSFLPAARRCSRDSIPCTIALRNKCSNGPAIFSRTLRSISTALPRISRLTRLSTSLEACRVTRYSRSEILANCTIRTRIKSCCKSRVRRACAAKSTVAPSTVRARFCCTEATSLTLSAIMRVISCKRVKRSNSSGSNSRSGEFAMRDVICVSACISISRSCSRRRNTLSVNSPSDWRSVPTSVSSLEREIDTSPA